MLKHALIATVFVSLFTFFHAATAEESTESILSVDGMVALNSKWGAAHRYELTKNNKVVGTLSCYGNFLMVARDYLPDPSYRITEAACFELVQTIQTAQSEGRQVVIALTNFENKAQVVSFAPTFQVNQ